MEGCESTSGVAGEGRSGSGLLVRTKQLTARERPGASNGTEITLQPALAVEQGEGCGGDLRWNGVFDATDARIS